MARTKQHTHSRNKSTYYKKQLKNRKLDPDQVLEKLTPEQIENIASYPPNPFLPGEGKFYCIFCDQHFISDHNLYQHIKGSVHKLRMKTIKEGGWTPKDALKAIGKQKELSLRKKDY